MQITLTKVKWFWYWVKPSDFVVIQVMQDIQYICTVEEDAYMTKRLQDTEHQESIIILTYYYLLL